MLTPTPRSTINVAKRGPSIRTTEPFACAAAATAGAEMAVLRKKSIQRYAIFFFADHN